MDTKGIEIVYSHDVKFPQVWLKSTLICTLLWAAPYLFGKYTDTTFPYIHKGDITQELVGSVGELDNRLNWCPVVSPHLRGDSNLLNCDVKMETEEEIVRFGIDAGGLWHPTNCVSRYRVAIIIPFRNRSRNLYQFLTYMHPFLTRQQLNYRIVVVEQTSTSPFNRAKLFNIGFVETLKLDQYDCFIFHDVDLLPLNDLNIYACTHHPRHMYSSVDTFRYNLPYRTIFGGAIAMQQKHFQKVNGFSNNFYGWGAEDDDMFSRITSVGLTFVRFDPEVSKYIMLPHCSSRQENNQEERLGREGWVRSEIENDGLSSLSYELLEHKELKLYTWFRVSC